jgi:hypothetical protein
VVCLLLHAKPMTAATDYKTDVDLPLHSNCRQQAPSSW